MQQCCNPLCTRHLIMTSYTRDAGGCSQTERSFSWAWSLEFRSLPGALAVYEHAVASQPAAGVPYSGGTSESFRSVGLTISLKCSSSIAASTICISRVVSIVEYLCLNCSL